MNKKTDNMDMDNAYMRAEQKRQETERHATRLKEFLIYGADIPEDIQKQYGFSEDYRLYKELEEMDGRQYSEKRQKGEVPDADRSRYFFSILLASISSFTSPAMKSRNASRDICPLSPSPCARTDTSPSASSFSPTISR